MGVAVCVVWSFGVRGGRSPVAAVVFLACFGVRPALVAIHDVCSSRSFRALGLLFDIDICLLRC